MSKTTAQEVSFEEAKPYLEVFQSQVEIPNEYHFHKVSKVKPNDVEAYLFRYQKDENKGFNGEHFCFLVSKAERKILGFTNMSQKYNDLNMLSRKETEDIAKKFLIKIDKSLANDLENLWIERHDEQIFVDNGKATTIAGMKYKCYRSSKDDYTWVIVGYDGSIVTFERDIKWNMEAQRRITEKWLHDSWVLDNTVNNTSKSALLLIETQNEWMHVDGKLRKALVEDEKMMLSSIANIEKSLSFAREQNIPVIYVRLQFEEGYPELANGESGLRKAIPNAGTFPKNGFGSEFYKSVEPLKGEFIVSGRMGASGFAGSNLDAYLRNNKIENLYLTGYATHVCVESTLREAHDISYNTFVISDATSAFNQKQQEYFLSEIVHHFGEHLTTEEFVK
jgi:nicotinamidase-related amidase